MRKKRATRRSTDKVVKVRKLRPVKTRASETATWGDAQGNPQRIRDMEDRHILNTVHFIERRLIEYDAVYNDFLREARFRKLLLNR